VLNVLERAANIGSSYIYLHFSHRATAVTVSFHCALVHCTAHRADASEEGARTAISGAVARARALPPLLHACCHFLHGPHSSGRGGDSFYDTTTQLTAATSSTSGNSTGAAHGRNVPLHRLRAPLLLGEGGESHTAGVARFALVVYFRTVLVFPALVRAWWTDDCAKRLRGWVEGFTQRHVTPSIIARSVVAKSIDCQVIIVVICLLKAVSMCC
jgi:hypothetical protein